MLVGYPNEAKFKKDGNFTNNEPISVLDTWSPSPSTSTSTFSSLNNPAAHLPAAAVRGGGMVADPQLPVHNAGPELSRGLSEKSNLGLEGFENLSESSVKQNEILKMLLSQGNVGFGGIHKNPNFTEFSCGNVFSGYNNNNNNPAALGLSGSGFSSNCDNYKAKSGFDLHNLLMDNNLQFLAPCMAFPQELENLDPKVEFFNPNSVQNPSMFGSQNVGCVVNSNLASLDTKTPFIDLSHELLPVKNQDLPPQPGFFQPPNFIPKHMPLLVPKQEPIIGHHHMTDIHKQQQIVYDQLYKAAELIQAGNFPNAQSILARLNQLLSPIEKPFQRSAFYVKEALEYSLTMPSSKISGPFDGMFKMGAYKVFSEVSPFTQFLNFTANQILLEALDNEERIHIIDFDIGFGAHWSSFLQELPRKNRGVTFVKITAFASPSTHNSVEISLMHENLTQFANELGINFELEVVNIDSFDANLNSVSSLRNSVNEAIAVNFPLWSFGNYLSALPAYLCLLKKLSPKILVSLDNGCDRIDLPFARHVLYTLEYYEGLMESVDAANVTSEASGKIEKFLFQPKIESAVLGRIVYPHIMPPWRSLFNSAGFRPALISNFAETQGECVVKKARVRGFNVERRNGSLVLSWQRRELLSVSAWVV